MTYDNHRAGTWTVFTQDLECVGVITKAGKQNFVLDTFGRKMAFKKLRQAKKWLEQSFV